MTRLMFSLNIFTYIVIAGCLDHREVSITENDQKSLQTQALNLMLVSPYCSLLFMNGLNYSMWTTYYGLSLNVG